MEINFKNIFGRINCFKKLSVKLAAAVLISMVGIANIHVVHAEPFFRVYRNGVIYYYFSNRANMLTDLRNGSRQQLRIGRLQANTRLAAQELEPWIKWASRHHNVPDSLIKAVIRVESNFNPTATSPKGAQGLMQLMPGTAEEMQVANPYDVQENIEAGTRYLGFLLKRFNNNLPLALAAYNAGPKRVQQFQGIPPIGETHNFIRDVCSNFLKFADNSSAP
jgi:hypothetical protein